MISCVNGSFFELDFLVENSTGINPLTQPESPGFLDRTLINIRQAWREFMFSGREIKHLDMHPELPDADITLLRRLMHECLEGKGGIVSSHSRAAVLGQAYLGLNKTGKKRYLEVLAKDFTLDREAIQEVKVKIDELENNPEQASYLRELLIPPRLKLLTQFNDLPQGVKFLVDLRSDLRSFMDKDPDLKALDHDLRGLLESWFDVGFLELKRLTWNEPAALLEKLIEYEAVHEISSWRDLRNRLGSDRRCYAFFHPCMPDEPLIFVEVALVKGMSDSIQELLDEEAPAINKGDADTAIFYSITNTQMGLQGIRFGSFLIKQVVDHLSRDLPNLKTFATLSPVPGFVRFLRTLPEDRERALMNEREIVEIENKTGKKRLREIVTEDGWHRDIGSSDLVREVLLRACAYYLVEAKRGNKALDRVADFHLNNGARLEYIHWLSDTSEKGLQQSAGIMVNYLYKLSDIEKNHELYCDSGKVATSTAINSLLKSVG